MVRWEAFEPERHGKPVGDLVHLVEQRTGHRALTDAKALARQGQFEGRSIVGLVDGAPVALLRALWYPAPSGDRDGMWEAEYVSNQRVDLLESCLAIFRDGLTDGARHAVWAWLDDLGAALLDAGYAETRRLLRLERSLAARTEVHKIDDVTVNTFRQGVDELSWLEVNNRAFAGHPENGGWTPDMVEERMGEPWFDPRGLLMAWRGEQLLGSCWTRKHDAECGEIYVLSVDPEAQGSGLGKVLLEAGLDDLHSRQGCTRCFLYVDDSNRRAVSLYGSFGFSTTLVNRMFEPTPTVGRE